MYVCLSVCLSMLASCRSQFLRDRLGRCLKLFVSTDSRAYILSQVRLSFRPSYFYTRKTPTNYREDRPSCMCLLNEQATPVTMRSRLNRQRAIGVATTAVKLSGDRLNRNSEKQQVKTERMIVISTRLKNVV